VPAATKAPRPTRAARAAALRRTAAAARPEALRRGPDTPPRCVAASRRRPAGGPSPPPPRPHGVSFATAGMPRCGIRRTRSSDRRYSGDWSGTPSHSFSFPHFRQLFVIQAFSRCPSRKTGSVYGRPSSKKRATLNVRRRKRGRSRHPAAGSSPLACCWSPPTRRRRGVSHTCGFVLAASHFFSSPTASCLSTFGWHKAQRVTRLLSVSVPPSDLGRPRCRAAESRRYREHIHARARRRARARLRQPARLGSFVLTRCRPRCRPRPVKTAD
jgi:hypothetical protein